MVLPQQVREPSEPERSLGAEAVLPSIVTVAVGTGPPAAVHYFSLGVLPGFAFDFRCFGLESLKSIYISTNKLELQSLFSLLA
jgi:hypothetical protein